MMVRIELINGGGSPTAAVSPSRPATAYWPAHLYYQHQNPYPYSYGLVYGYAPYGSYPECYDLNHQPQPGRVSGWAAPKLEKGSTTLMIRNLPTKLRRHELINLLDEHCKEQNRRRPLNWKRHSAYDFLYLPFDFSRGGNLGYAFVNFTTPAAAFTFFNSWNGKTWINFYKCTKICAITTAAIQGKEASKRHLDKCKFFCETQEFLPVEFCPPRSGYNGAAININTLGIWVAKDQPNYNYCNKTTVMTWRKKE